MHSLLPPAAASSCFFSLPPPSPPLYRGSAVGCQPCLPHTLCCVWNDSHLLRLLSFGNKNLFKQYNKPSYIEAMLQRALLLACMLAMAQAQAKHIVYYNPSDECKNELCWQCARPLYLPIHPHLAHMSPSSSRYLIPFWLIAVLLIIVAVCCKMMYAM
jgi:hypothetical protein